VPQPPQFAGSDDVSTHDEPQLVAPAVQPEQVPLAQATRDGQAVPQPPQLAGSDVVSTQAPLQATPGEQAARLRS
jgi:hypothetical protein